MYIFRIPRGPSTRPCGRPVQRHGSLLVYGWPNKMFYPSTREVVSSSASFPSQSVTHVLSVANFCPNLHTGKCCHTTEEKRPLTGKCVIDGVRLAVQKVYNILEVYEVNEYVTRHDPKRGKAACLQDT